jgi:hypothetical protein
MEKKETFHAPADTKNQDEIKRENNTVASLKHVEGIFDALSHVIMILNAERQIIFSNKMLLKELGIESEDEILGKRPGNALACINAEKMSKNGCGTSEACRYCGAVNTIMRCQESGRKEEGECRIIGKIDGKHFYHDLKVVASPFVHNNDTYTVFSLLDISDQKRKRALERIFFHDIINIAGSLTSIMDILPLLGEDEKGEYLDTVGVLSRQMIDEIRAQQQLVKAENDELSTKKESLLSKDILEKALKQIFHHQVAHDRVLRIATNTVQQSFQSDSTLLNRVLINMMKNALEATLKGGTVEIGCDLNDNQLRFWVHNETVMPEEVKSQVFQRSFSTKGGGRGLGTYSIKLLSEKYLKGTVGFTSEEGKGTCFFVSLPMILE